MLHRAVDHVDQRVETPSGSRLVLVATLNLVMQVLESLSSDMAVVTAVVVVLPAQDLQREPEELEVLDGEHRIPWSSRLVILGAD
ncbi:MAG: hypothetical protein JWP06_1152 [Candidatus Saccharibacteria bacterium]|nr:hypothetical protein [Candidatus Saccharibacteria bacterium]